MFRAGAGPGSSAGRVLVRQFRQPWWPRSRGIDRLAINANTVDTPVDVRFAGPYPAAVTPWVTSAALDLAAHPEATVGDGHLSAVLPPRAS